MCVPDCLKVLRLLPRPSKASPPAWVDGATVEAEEAERNRKKAEKFAKAQAKKARKEELAASKAAKAAEKAAKEKKKADNKVAMPAEAAEPTAP